MNWKQMQERCPSASFVGIAELRNHRLSFTRRSRRWGGGVADAVPANGCSVWGVVYQVDEQDIDRLDKFEGYVPGSQSNAYIRKERQVYVDGDESESLLVSLYYAKAEEGPPLPNVEYRRIILEGARYWHLPATYVQELESIEVEG